MSATRQLPLYCDFRELVVGKRFVAGIEVHARLIAEETLEGDSGWWLFGVNPGAIAASGSNLAEAVADFRTRLKGVLFDFAAESRDFESFRAQVTEFFKESDAETEADWVRARAAVRAGKLSQPGLHRETSGRGGSVRVVQLRLQPAENRLDKGPSLAA